MLVKHVEVRNFTTHPYSDDEKRIVNWIMQKTKGNVGGGDDPIGFIMASHDMINAERIQLREAVVDLREMISDTMRNEQREADNDKD